MDSSRGKPKIIIYVCKLIEPYFHLQHLKNAQKSCTMPCYMPSFNCTIVIDLRNIENQNMTCNQKQLNDPWTFLFTLDHHSKQLFRSAFLCHVFLSRFWCPLFTRFAVPTVTAFRHFSALFFGPFPVPALLGRPLLGTSSNGTNIMSCDHQQAVQQSKRRLTQFFSTLNFIYTRQYNRVVGQSLLILA